MKISIIFYLCTIVGDGNASVSDETFVKFLKWIFINGSIAPSTSKAKISVYFSRIEATVWKLILKNLGSKPLSQKLLNTEFDNFCKETSKIKNPIFRKIYEKKIYNASNKLIQDSANLKL